MKTPVLETPRLILRAPVEADFEPLCAMMQDEETTRFIGGVQEPAMAWRGFCTILGHWQLRGYGFFSVLDRSNGEWLGRVGPWNPHLWPQPEIGWSIKREAWGQGFAGEAASASMDHVVDTLGWTQVIHLIDENNHASQGVARGIGSRFKGRRSEVPGFGMVVDIWEQDADDWRKRRAAAQQVQGDET